MSLLPDLENELHRAAARPRRRFWPVTRGGIALVVGFVVVGGAATAAGLSLVGADPDAAEHFEQGIPTAITGKPVRDGTLMPVRTDDPDGGPPWGIRVTTTSRGAACIQVGRVVDDQLVVLGRDGAFANDGRAHVVPAGRDICVPTAADGTPILRSRGATLTSSGLSRCNLRVSRTEYEQERRAAVARLNGLTPGPAKRYRPATDASWAGFEAAMCPEGAQRAIRWGFLGSRASAVSLGAADGSRTHQPLAPGGFGAYLFVQRLGDDRAASFEAMQRPATVQATFGTGRALAITGPDRVRTIPGVNVPRPDRERGPVETTVVVPHVPTDPVRVRFRAPVDALRYPTAFKAYVEDVKTDDRAANDCRNAQRTASEEPSMPVTPPIRKGERATLVVTPPRRFKGKKAAWCPGPHRLRLIQIGGSKKGSITLATKLFTVR